MEENQPLANEGQLQQPAVNAEQPVKTLPQDHVNELIGSAKQKGFQKGYQQALAEFQANAGMQSPAPAAGIDEEKVNRIVAEKLAQQQAEQIKAMQAAQGQKAIAELSAKINADKSKYPDFDEVTNQIPFHEMPQILHYANLVDNAGDVLYDLSKNPSKIGTILSSPTPTLAALQIKQLSDSIKQNQMATAQANPSEPLSQVKPSNIGISNGVPKTAADYRKMYRGR